MIYYLTYQEREQITKIHDHHRIIESKNSIDKVMDMLCHQQASTLKGQRQGIRDLTKFVNKVPIVLNIEGHGCIFFSVRNKKQIWWFNYSYINFYINMEEGLLVDYGDHKLCVLDVSYYVFHHQMKRCNEIKQKLQAQSSTFSY
ncbi:MAG: competence protein ComK [Erysipelotrichaceae bacterium]